MRKILLATLTLLFSSPLFASAPPYSGISQPSGGTVTQYLSGNLCVAASSSSAGTCAVNVNGATGVVTGTTTIAQNVVNGTTSALLYQSGPSVTTSLPIGTTNYVLSVANGAPSWSAAASSATNIVGGGAGVLPYQSAANTTAMLAAGTQNYVLQSNGASAPSWSAAASSATNVAGGGAGTLPYQSAANTTAMLAAGTQNYVLQSNGAGAPSWSAAASSATNVAGGTGGSIPYQSAANTTAMLANGSSGQVLQSNGGTSAPSWTNVSGTLSGGVTNVVPVWTSASSLGNGNNYITNMSTGVGINGPITAYSNVTIQNTKTNNICIGGGLLISSNTWNNVTTSTFTLNYANDIGSAGSTAVFVSSTAYHLYCSFLNGNNTNADMGLVFGDGTNAFFGAFYGGFGGTFTTGTGFTSQAPYGGGYIALHGQPSSGTMQANSNVETNCDFSSVYGSTMTVKGTCESVWDQQAGSTSQPDALSMAGQFPSKTVSSIMLGHFTTLSNSTVDTLSGTWSGYCELCAGRKHP